jgi:hypothetical protein
VCRPTARCSVGGTTPGTGRVRASDGDPNCRPFPVPSAR